jgi:hypothetical protein
MYLASVSLVLFVSAFHSVVRGVTIRLSLNFILGFKIYTLDGEDRVS